MTWKKYIWMKEYQRKKTEWQKKTEKKVSEGVKETKASSSLSKLDPA